MSDVVDTGYVSEYVVQCLLAAGYDAVDAISAIDDDTISEIEKYIDKRKQHYPQCMRPDWSSRPDGSRPDDTCQSSLPFEFPPGHRIRINKFAQTIKSQFTPKVSFPPSKKRKCKDSLTSSKKKKYEDSESESETKEDIHSVTGTIRKKILKWTHDFQKGKYAKVIEGKHYSIKVKQSTINPTTCDASIVCICGNSYVASKKPNGERVISNWSKHFKVCIQKEKKSLNQGSLQNFFIPAVSSQSSQSSTTSTSDKIDLSYHIHVIFYMK
jgi:hypothetical protein